MPDEIANNEFEPAEAPPSGEIEAGADVASAHVSSETAPDHDIAVASESEPAADSLAAEDGETAPAALPPEEKKMHWYVVKVQSGREESIRGAIERRVKIEGLEEFFSKIIIPVEKTAEMRNGKRVVKERKLYPGYLMVEVEYNDRILYLFRETSGVGDFVGGSLQHAPAPMTGREVERMLGRQGEKDDVKVIHQKPKYDRGDRVKVKEGTFAGMEGEVKELIEAKGQVRMELTIFGRPVLVELEYWQVEHV
ncbi:transcription termination/antitermination protein NusG [soil metagenome]